MAFSRQWLLILFALILGGGQIFAAGAREERAYAAALAAFHDGVFGRAEAELAQFTQTYRKSANLAPAVLYRAQAQYQLGRFHDAAALLTDTNYFAKAQAAGLADQYVYWTGTAQLAAGDFQDAADTFVLLAENFPKSPLGPGALVAAAAAFEKLGKWAQADGLLENPNGLFQRAAQLDPAGQPAVNGRLLQAESKNSQNDFSAAIRILNLLNPAALTPEQDWKRSLQLYRASLGMGDLDTALAATTNLLQIARSSQGNGWTANLAESVAAHAGLLEKGGRLAAAGAAWQENLTNRAPVERQREAILKIAALAAAQNDFTNSAAALEKYLAQFADSPVAELALLTLGEFYLKDYVTRPAAGGQLAAAQEKFDQLLAADTSSPLAGKAFLDRGWCRWLAGNLPESLADFQTAAQKLPPSEDLAVTRFKMGDTQFALKDFSGAQTNYQAVLSDFPALTNVASSLGDRALYQILRARLELHDAPGADEAMRPLLEEFATSAPADSGLLLAGEGFSDFASPAKAREVFRSFENERRDSPLLPQVAFAAARTFEREQNWPAAVTNYDNWLEEFPTNDLRPQVEYALAWAVSRTGDEAGAFALFTKYIGQFTNSFTPLAQMWVADHFFRLGGTDVTNFGAAEFHYQLIFQDFPTNELAYPAKLMAGRAAMGQFSSDAGTYFKDLINDTNCPAELRVKARFAYSDALRQMTSSDTNNANLILATNILSQLCPMAATNEAGALAWSDIGDCDLQLGALDDATNAYAQAMNSPAAGAGLRSRAQVGLGLVLEKMAEGLPPGDADRKTLLAMALNDYLDVFYGKNLRDEDQPDLLWKKEAGLRAAPLVGLLNDADTERKFYAGMQTALPQLKDALDKKIAALPPPTN